MPWRRRKSSGRSRFKGRPFQRKKPIWINHNSSTAQLAVFAHLAELVSPRDYTDDYPDRQRQESCVVQRCLGRVLVDTVVDAPGGNAIIWSSMIIRFSQEALENVLTADPSDLFIHDFTTRTENMTRLDVLQSAPIKGYSSAFRFIRTGEGIAGDCSDFFSEISLDFEILWEWDINVKRKLKTDEGLYLLTSGAVLCSNEISAFVEVNARTLIYDD